MVKMKLSIGYHAGGDDGKDCSWSREVSPYRGSVGEVFFSLPGMASGVRQADSPQVSEASRFYRDLERFRALGIQGVLLFDAACYGGGMVSPAFFEQVRRGIAEARRHIRLKAVVTMMPPLAEFMKGIHPELEVRASVHNRIGSVSQMEYAGRCYDGFYVNSDLNRDVSLLEKARKWCDAHGKTLHMVANSGCLYDCPFHLEHLNVMGHWAEIVAAGSTRSSRDMPCRELLSGTGNHAKLLQGGWIRPEDLSRVEGFFDTVALLSSDVPQARNVLKAYTEGRWGGNMLELLEPCHACLAGVPSFPDDAFPEDWFEKTSSCGHACDSCGYCGAVLEKMSSAASSKGGE